MSVAASVPVVLHPPAAPSRLARPGRTLLFDFTVHSLLRKFESDSRKKMAWAEFCVDMWTCGTDKAFGYELPFKACKYVLDAVLKKMDVSSGNLYSRRAHWV